MKGNDQYPFIEVDIRNNVWDSYLSVKSITAETSDIEKTNFIDEFIMACYSSWTKKLYFIAFKKLNNTDMAQNAVQNTYLKLIDKVKQDPYYFENVEHIKNWLKKCLKDRCIEEWRHATAQKNDIWNSYMPYDLKHENLFFDLAPEITTSTIEESYLSCYLDQLKPKDKELIKLYYFEKLDVLYLSKHYGCSIEALRKRRTRAIAKLAEIMKGPSNPTD